MDQDPIQSVEDLFLTLQSNVTIEAKNIIWHFISSAKQYYPKSALKKEWEQLLNDLALVINDFENQLHGEAEVKLYALQKNLDELVKNEAH